LLVANREFPISNFQTIIENYLFLAKVLMHLAQALTLLPLVKRTHCKLGYFFFLAVGLYLPRRSRRVTPTTGDLAQIWQILDMPILSKF
jgi:hypothetical protein